MKKATKILVLIFAISLILSSCKITDTGETGKPSESPGNPLNSGTPSIANPWEEFWSVPIYKTSDGQELVEYLEILLSEYPGRYGIHFSDMQTGFEIGIRDNEKYISADSTAIPVNLFLYNLLAQGGAVMSDEIELQETDRTGEIGDISSAAAGTKFTLEQISDASLRQNDMTAVTMLVRFLKQDNIDDYLLSIGAQNTEMPIYSSPYDMAIFMEQIYRLDVENPGIYSGLVVALMETGKLAATSLIPFSSSSSGSFRLPF